MKLIFILLLILFLAFSGYHLTFRGFRLPLFARKFYLTGTEFLFLGLLIGPQFLDLMDSQTIIKLEPLTAFLLGWIGLLFGFQFEINMLRRYPIEFLLSTLIEGLLTSTIVFAGIFSVSIYCFDLSLAQSLMAALVLSTAAACTSQTGLALISSDATGRKRNLVAFLRYISAIDGLNAMLILGAVFFLRPMVFESNTGLSGQSLNIIMVICLCGGLLVLFALFLFGRLAESEMVLVVIGMAVITGGSAAVLNFSPLLANFVLGFFLVNLTPNKERIFQMLVGVEKPVYLLILIFLGVNWRIDSVWFFVLAGGYAFLRASGKLVGGFSLRLLSAELGRFTPFLGLGLLAPGGMTLAVLLDFQKGFPADFSALILSIALPAVIYSDVASVYVLKKVIQMD